MKKRLALTLSLVIVLFLAVGLLTACGKGSTAETKTKVVIQSLKGPVPEIGQTTECPVMKGNKFKVTASTLKVKVDGKTYYVCCGGCPGPLKKNPKKYLK